MNYLKYIELSAENLQFFLWFRSYTKRFDQLPANEKSLSPVWYEDSETDGPARPKSINPEAAAIFKGTDFANDSRVADAEKSNPFYTPPHTPKDIQDREAGDSFDSYDISMTSAARTDHAQRATDAFEGAGLKWKPRKCSYLHVTGSASLLITVASLCPTISRRNQSGDLNLYRRGWQSRTQPFLQGA